MSLPITDVGVGGLAIIVVARESFNFARYMISRKNGNCKEKRCVDSEGVQLSIQNNRAMAESTRRMEGHMEKISENSTIQVTLLRQLNGNK